jgi:serine/threonine protein kinase/Tol biopolymer transport system component
MIGKTLAHYQITAHLGTGGMGEVYQASDIKLARSVAIKLLPAAFASDADRLARFSREAQMLAALNHPNIAQIYGIEESGETPCIVMELVQGETLHARIQRGPIPVNEALGILKQIAEGLEAAHDKGVIHRDLKPGNIMLTEDGKVKVLDFGLAKAYEGPSGNPALSNSPTMASIATNAGMIVGTAAYMAPEQAKGRAVDRRADIFALGCILYEMLTGKRAFDGEDVTDILGAVLRIEPDWSQLPENVPPSVRRLLRLYLEKNPKNRRSDATDVRLDIEHVLKEPADTQQVTLLEAPKRPLWKRAVPVLAALIIGVLAGGAVWKLWPVSAAMPPLTRFSIILPKDQNFTNTGRELVAISSDGTQMVYVANTRLYHRQMSELEARPIPGTEVFQGVLNPVFSPDGKSLVFQAVSDRTLRKIAVTGGASVTLCSADNSMFGVSWGDDGIVFAEGSKGISRVSENGGKPELLIKPESDERLYGPQILPGGQSILYTAVAGNATWDKAKIYVQSLKSATPRQLLVDGGRDARYVFTGHLVYAYQATVFAIPFDSNSLKVIGGPTPVVEGVRAANGNATAASQFSFAANGTLIYIPGSNSAGNDTPRTLAYLDRKAGSLERLKIPFQGYAYPRVSPDRKYAAVTVEGEKDNIWIVDLTGAVAPRQLTLGSKNRSPVWSPDGQTIAFDSDRDGDRAIFRQKADGTGVAERLTKAEAGSFHAPESWSPDGKYLSYLISDLSGKVSLSILSIPDKKVTAFAESAAKLTVESTFSPDGRWLAYMSNETGTNEIFVQPFPATGAKYSVAKGGQPFWSRDGKELYFNPGAGKIGVISITTKPTFSFGEPIIFATSGLTSRAPSGSERMWDIAPDGQRLIGVADASLGANPEGNAEAPALRIEVVENWFTDLKERVPVK